MQRALFRLAALAPSSAPAPNNCCQRRSVHSSPEPTPRPNPSRTVRQRRRAQSPARVAERIVESYARRPQEPRSVADQLDLGRQVMEGGDEGEAALYENARHVQRAIPARLARAVQHQALLPPEAAGHEGMNFLSTQCVDGVLRFHEFDSTHGPVEDAEGEAQLRKLLHGIRDLVASTGNELLRLRMGVGQARALPGVDPGFFDVFAAKLLRSAVSWALPVHHHLNLTSSRGIRHVGAYDTLLRPTAVCADTAFRVEGLFMRDVGVTPHILISGDESASVEYVEAHLDYILAELFKNSAKATLRKHSSSLPPIQVHVSGDDSVVRVRVSDEGGGIEKPDAAAIFRYGYTTAHDEGSSGLDGRAALRGGQLAGWGFGLPRSRVYAQYLGGDLQLVENNIGVGCAFELTMPRPESGSAEKL
eukprot:Hpha_TRINITY_DN13892_c0_g1::TRINITY_DN13892_c0_g1_i1::g.69633::m.69633